MHFLCYIEAFQFYEFYLLNGILFRKSFPTLTFCRYCLCFLWAVSAFLVSQLGLWSAWSPFYRCYICVSLHSSLCGYAVFPATFVDDFVFPVFVFGIFVKSQMAVIKCAHVCIFYFVPLTYMSILAPLPYWFYYYSSVIYILKYDREFLQHCSFCSGFLWLL